MQFSRKYTKLAMLSYCLRSEEQNNFSKNLPSMGIDPTTLRLCDLLCVHYQPFVYTLCITGKLECYIGL